MSPSLRRPKSKINRFRPWHRRRKEKLSELLVPGVPLFLLVLSVFGPSDLWRSEKKTIDHFVHTIDPTELTIIDGDTIRYRGSTIRLLGFDTPETFEPNCAAELTKGNLATARLRTLVSAASVVGLQYNSESDRYGRSLASLFLDGQDVGDLLIKESLARSYSGGQRLTWCS